MSYTYEDKSFFLFCFLPMQYDTDSVAIDHILEEAGFGDVTEANIDQAIKVCRRGLEKALWEDNVAKQLLGRLLDGDLDGDEVQKE